jgi:hypothetical protein
MKIPPKAFVNHATISGNKGPKLVRTHETLSPSGTVDVPARKAARLKICQTRQNVPGQLLWQRETVTHVHDVSRPKGD